jgi:hypothetical protein
MFGRIKNDVASTVPTEDDIAEFVDTLPSWAPPRYELQLSDTAPPPAPVEWSEPVRCEITVPVKSVSFPEIPEGWGATFELPAVR